MAETKRRKQSVGEKIGAFFTRLGADIADIFTTFKNGDWKTRISYVVMGFGSFARGQWGRGLLFFIFQTVFNWYMVHFGGAYVAKLGTLGHHRNL